jgi:hypothetical protein
MKIETMEINRDDADVLIGPEGVVWVQPAFGASVIIAARNGAERAAAVAWIAALLQMGLVPYGLPSDQRLAHALFGGSAIRDCTWLAAVDAPAPRGDGEGGYELPTRYVIAVTEHRQGDAGLAAA